MNPASRLGLVAAAALCVAPAAAQASTFSGSCPDIAGKATFGKPLSNTQADNTYDFAGTAHCDGTVNGKDVKGAPVTIHVAGPGNMSCSNGKSTTPGKGAITFADGTVIPFLMDFSATLTEVDITLKGLKSGSGTGHASFFNQSDPSANLTTAQNCGGAGNKELSFTANSKTDSPLDDGQSTQSAGGAQDQGASGGSTQGSGPSSSGSAPTSGSSESPSSSSQPKAKPKHKKHKAKKHKKHKAKKHRAHKNH